MITLLIICLASLPDLLTVPLSAVGISLALLSLLMVSGMYSPKKTLPVSKFKKLIFSYFIFAFASAGVLKVVEFAAAIRETGLQAFLEQNGAAAHYIFFAICFLQPIALPFPEAITVIAGSAVLGPLAASILSLTGTTLGIIVMFYAARFGGEPLIRKIVEKEKIERYHYYVRKNETLILILLFIFPLLPDEVICIGAGLSGISASKLIPIAFLSKVVTSFSLAYSTILASVFNIGTTELLLLVFVVFSAGYLGTTYYKRNFRSQG